MDSFSHDLNASMMFKGQHPEYMILVSLENNFSTYDDFWSNPEIQNQISSNAVVVRLSEEQNQSDIQLFENTFHNAQIPSVFIFGSNQSSITKEWGDHFPTKEEFLAYFSQTDSNINSESNSANPQEQANNDDNTDTLHQVQNSVNSNQISTQTSTQPSSIPTHVPLSPIEKQKLVKRPPSKSQPIQKNTLMLTRPEADTTQNRNKNIARLSIQGLHKTFKKEFQPNSTIGELRSWLRNEFGRECDWIVVHTHMPLPNDPSITLQQADLYPSAAIKERDGGQAILKDDEDLNLGIVDRTVSSHSESSAVEQRPEPVINIPRQSTPASQDNSIFGKICMYCKLLFSLLNPWDDDDNESNDEFHDLWEYQPNPNHINTMLTQMYPNVNNIPQDDWRSSML